MPTFTRLLVVCLTLVLFAAVLVGCIPPATNQLGPRPATDTLGAVEAYLRKYQPGPLPRVFQTSRLYDRHGALLAERWSEGRRTWIPLNRVSKHLIDATIATEDATFLTNPGVDAARIAGAALGNAQEGDVVSGASTITMQLARNLFLGDDQRYQQSMDRKLLEAGLAQEVTSLFSKDEILEMYLNLLNYGHMAYGPEAAAQIYFGKSAADLTLAEATLLAGIPQQPANLDLFTNFDAAKARQRVVLDMMVRHGFLSQPEADKIHAEPVALNPAPDQVPNAAPHFTQYVWDVLDSRLGEGVAVRSGLVVTTTLDLKMQELAQKTVARKVKELKPKHDLNNASLVAMRPESGEILAMVGSADFNDTSISGQVNVATSPRQPGSAIKPLVYATALNDDLISPATILWDVPVTYTVGNRMTYTPVNYDGKFHGPVTVRTALANSYNIPAVKLLDAVTVERMLRAAEAFGIRSLNRGKEWYGLSLTLGGGEMTLLELTSAYAALASGGQAVDPEPILAAADALGRPVAGALPKRGEPTPVPVQAPVQAVSPAAAFQVTDILSDNAARTPMFGAASPLKLSRPAAAKTGTTDDFRDNWTVGYLRPLVTGVWAGNTDGHPMKKVSGIAGAAPIWHDFMEGVLADKTMRQTLGVGDDAVAWQFVPPADVEQRPDCPPGATCREGGEYFSRAWLDAAGEAGPLADSVVKAPSAPVYAALPEGGRWTAYCRAEPAAVRPLLKLPGQLGLPGASGVITGTQTAEFSTDALQAIGWSLRHPTPVDLGPCGTLAEIALRALALDPQSGDAALVISADLAAAMDPNAGPVPGDTTLPAVAASPADFRYALARPVENNASCPGNYIVGQVVNRLGAPVAGVHIVMVDEWGNRADAVSKGGEADYGRYDLLINSFANRYTLTVVDPSGNIASPAVVVEHLQGAAGDAPCHTVVWIGG
jgi:penicillin-binding protein 1C